MTRCPTCNEDTLELDAIGGHGPKQPSRPALLCPACWTVVPLVERHLSIVHAERRDLA